MLVLNHSPSVLLTKHFASLSSKKFCIHFHIFPCIPDLNIHQNLETIGFAKNIQLKENLEVVKEIIERETKTIINTVKKLL